MSLQDAWKAFQSSVMDLATLDVVTLSGKIELNRLAGTAAPALGDLPDVIQAAIKTAGIGAAVQVVALTHVEADLDTTHFVQTDATASLLEAHKEIVKSAHDARNAFLRMVKELVVGL